MKKILLVDDEPNIIMSLEYTFKKNNFQVFIARDGQEAIEILKTNSNENANIKLYFKYLLPIFLILTNLVGAKP